MSHPRTAYELRESQVTTPEPVVSLFWRLTRQHRPHMASVLDLGAGDCRFAAGGAFDHYTGIEIDRQRIAAVPTNGQIICGCAFRHDVAGYEGGLSNTPYVRRHDLQPPGKEPIISPLHHQLAVSLTQRRTLAL